MGYKRNIFVILFLIVFATISPKTISSIGDFFATIHLSVNSSTLYLPSWLDYAAVIIFGVTGTMVAQKKKYDFVGAFVLAGITACGGALIRDGICVQDGISPILQDGNYMIALIFAWILGIFFCGILERFNNFIVICDAIGLGLYGVLGTNKALIYELSLPVAIGIGLINAVGGGLLRDVIAREEPMIFKPGQFYTVVALVGCITYVILQHYLYPTVAAILTVVITLLLRMITIKFNWHSSPIQQTQDTFWGWLSKLLKSKK